MKQLRKFQDFVFVQYDYLSQLWAVVVVDRDSRRVIVVGTWSTKESAEAAARDLVDY